MTAPVDLTNLRSMTDGDAELEDSLFEEFYSSFEAGIAAMRASMTEDAAEAWRQQAHALKGVALNLGADALGMLCKEAQEAYASSVEDKRSLLDRILAEYQSVRQYLHHVR